MARKVSIVVSALVLAALIAGAAVYLLATPDNTDETLSLFATDTPTPEPSETPEAAQSPAPEETPEPSPTPIAPTAATGPGLGFLITASLLISGGVGWRRIV